MWFLGFRGVFNTQCMRGTILQSMNLFRMSSSFEFNEMGKAIQQLQSLRYCTAVDDDADKGNRKSTLAKDLAILVEESPNFIERKPTSRMELKRLIELRIKKRVKEQYVNGKFQELMKNVVAKPETLEDAYNSIKLNSNVDLTSNDENICFESMSEELTNSTFDVNANIFCISTKGARKETLVMPKLKLKIVQEAIRIVLEIIYRPQFSKISHGCRSGRGHHTALKYVGKEISNPDWWFTLIIRKKMDVCILSKLISMMEEKINDPDLYDMIKSMFDAHALNIEFGGFPKGHGLPQEGVLSPILINIYMDMFDREFCRLSMNYEALHQGLLVGAEQSRSQLRSWFRRQLKGNITQSTSDDNSRPRIHCCRFMDELFFAVSGPEDLALRFKSDIFNFLQISLHLDVDSQTEILSCLGPQSIRFLGSLVQRRLKETPALRAVHKLKEKVNLFALQKQEAWEMGTVRIGKKWLAHGLRKVKESEIKHLADSSSLLSQILYLRKAGMETDHWYKLLMKIWMQDIKAEVADNEEVVLSNYVAEPALPRELTESFYAFQKHAQEYVSSETAATLAQLPGSSSCPGYITEVIAPIVAIKKRLARYGLVTSKGHTRVTPLLILQDDTQILDWYSGIVRRWLKWYSDYDNFTELQLVIRDQVRKSCVRTLAAKYRVNEVDIERRFDSELSRIPSTSEIGLEIVSESIETAKFDNDEALMYGISYGGQCLLSLARIASQSRPCKCFVMGCSAAAPSVYALHVMERQKFPSWKTGFSTSIHPSLNRRRIGVCKNHVKDLYIGNISLQSIDFSSWGEA